MQDISLEATDRLFNFWGYADVYVVDDITLMKIKESAKHNTIDFELYEAIENYRQTHCQTHKNPPMAKPI